MEDEIYAAHRIVHAVVIPDVADVELQSIVVKGKPHILLLLFIATKYADFADIRICEMLDDCIPEGSSPPCYQQSLVFEHFENALLKLVHSAHQIQPDGWFIARSLPKAKRIQRSIDYDVVIGHDLRRSPVGFCNKRKQIIFGNWRRRYVIHTPEFGLR